MRLSFSILFFLSVQLVNGQSLIIDSIFYNKAASFFNKNITNGVVNYQNIQKDTQELLDLLIYIDNLEAETLQEMSKNEALSFYLNAYNLSVIKGVVLHYPIESPQAVSGFFDKEKHLIAGELMTLNYLENEVIRPLFEDPRIHFALNCAAKGCPPLSNEPFYPEKVEEQLAKLTQVALLNPTFVDFQEDQKTVNLSPIFDWYFADFGANKKGLFAFINEYRAKANLSSIPNNTSIVYNEYDWQLNDASDLNQSNFPIKNEANRYFASALYKKGLYEIHLFNNLYYEIRKDKSASSSFHTSLGRFLYGLNDQVNIGFDLRYRWTGQSSGGSQGALYNFLKEVEPIFPSPSTPGYQSRVELSGIGPKIKYTPFKKRGNISIQHTLIFPLTDNLDGKEGDVFIDYDGLILFNQFFYDLPINNRFSLFFELDLNVEGLPLNFFSKEATFFQLSAPITFIPSWFPDRRQTVYALLNAAPAFFFDVQPPEQSNRFNESFSPWGQLGLGYKYRILEKFEVELLYTGFFNSAEKTAHTFNLGLRYWK